MPEATVAAILLDETDRKVLLTRRNGEPFRGYWCLPGGHIDAFEAVADAVAREVKEETGLDFDGTFAFYHDEIMAFRGIHAVVLVFAGEVHGNVAMQAEEVSEVGWFALEQAVGLPMAFQHQEILRRYAGSQR